MKLLLRNTFSIRKTKCANLSFGVVAKGLFLLTQSKIVDSANATEVAAESVPPTSPNQGRGRSASVLRGPQLKRARLSDFRSSHRPKKYRKQRIERV